MYEARNVQGKHRRPYHSEGVDTFGSCHQNSGFNLNWFNSPKKGQFEQQQYIKII